MAKNKPWDVVKRLGLKGPHPVDSKLGFVNATITAIDPTSISGFYNSYGTNFDRMRIGRIEDGRRYLGNNCYEHVNVEESRLNEWD